MRDSVSFVSIYEWDGDGRGNVITICKFSVIWVLWRLQREQCSGSRSQSASCTLMTPRRQEDSANTMKRYGASDERSWLTETIVRVMRWQMKQMMIFI